MIAADVLEIVCQRLEGVFVPRGFTRRDPQYTRAADGVRQIVEVSLADFAPKFELSLTFGLRVEAAEALFAQFWYVSPTSRDETTTCCFTLKDLVPEVGEEIAVRDKRSLRSALAALIPALEREVLPFLDAHQDLASIDRLMNGAHPELFDSAAEPYHSMSAIIVAYLAQNRALGRLMRAYRGRIRDCEDADSLERYDRLVRYLRGHPV